MATGCGDCENGDYTPDASCCPDTQDFVNAIDGRDRNCKIRRILPAKGFLANLLGSNKAGFLDGSADQPIGANFEQVLSSDGYVIIQTQAGRILALKPDDESSQLLSLVWDGGVLKFAPITFDATFDDATISSVKSGFLAALACSGTGKLTIGKFLPGCEGTRYLTIDAAGNVTCDTVEVGNCRNVTAVDELDSLWGCKEGVFSPIVPVEGKTLIGEGASPNTKWVIGESSSGIQLINPRVLIAQGGFGEGFGTLYSGNIAWASQSGYLAKYRYVIVRAIAQLGSNGIDCTGVMRMDGINIANTKVREHPVLSGDHDTDSNQQILEIPGSKTSLLEWVVTDLGNSNLGEGLNQSGFSFYLEGWVA